MPRPKLHSDDTVLDAALSVLLAKGPSAFTLSDVADAVGLSRAALIQRFRDKANLHLKVMERLTQQTRDHFASADPAPGLGPLWDMLQDLIAGMGDGPGTEGYLLLMWADAQDDALRALAAERHALVLRAIQTRLPDHPHPPAPTALLLQAVIQGACMQWLIQPQGTLAGFMLDQTRSLLKVLYPDQTFA